MATGAADPAAAAVRLVYRYAGNGLKGEVEEVAPLHGPAFVVTRRIGGYVEQDGFDGAQAWARERSGSVSTQAGGDMQPLAINQAYRSTGQWWRPDYGVAAVSYAGQRRDGETRADVLRITPRGGLPFEAWFDRSTHLLTRVDEHRHGQDVVVRLANYRRVAGMMVAGRVSTGTGDPADAEVETLDKAEFLPAVPRTCCAKPDWSPNDVAIANGAMRASIPFRIVNGHIYGDVRVNGKGPFAFMFDTGGVNILTPETARAAGIGATGSLAMRGGGAGSISGGIARVRSLEIGAAMFQDQPMRVLPMSDSDVDQGGMIGFETFRRLVTRIDYGRQRIEFIEPSAFDPKEAGSPVPLVFYGNLLIARGSYDGIAGDFTIDTGNPGSIFLSSPFAARHALRERAKGGIRTIAGVGIGGPSYGLAYRGGPLTLGGVTVPRPVALLSSDTAGAMADASLAGNIGAGILRRFVVTLDYAHSRMYLKPIVPAPTNLDRYDQSGLRLSRVEGRTVVTDVIAHGPAALAGVRQSDVVTMVEGRAVATMTLDEIRSLLRDQPAGTRVRLSLGRQGESVPVVLTLHPLV